MSEREKLQFKPKLWPTLGTAVGLAMLLALGTWQTVRYFEKREIEAERAAHVDDARIQVDSFAQFQQKARSYSPIEVRGHLDPDYTFLFKHRTHNGGQPGYWVGGVLRFAQGPGALIVNRGWVHRDSAAELAAIPPSSDTQTFTGLVYQPQRVISDDDTRAQLKSGEIQLKNTPETLPVEWETYDLSGIAQALSIETPATPTILVLGPEHTRYPYPIASLEYVTQPYMTAERHLGYLTFWYLTALGLLGMYFANALGLLVSGQHRPAPSQNQPQTHRD